MDAEDDVAQDDGPIETARQRAARVSIEAGTIAAAVTASGLVAGGPVSAIAAGGLGVLATTWHGLRRMGSDQAAFAVGQGAKGAGLTADQFAAWAENDPRHAAVVIAVVEAAARSTSEAHLDTLARVLADAATAPDGARIDLDLLIARALGTIGPAHLQVLTLIAQEDPRATAEGSTSAYTAETVSRRRPHLGAGVDALVAALAATGAVTVDATRWDRTERTHYAVTPFGRACLAFLDDRGPAVD